MGMYDTIVGECPSCKKEFQIQTKLMDRLLYDIVVGDVFMPVTYTGKIGLKFGCDECTKPITAHIESGILTKFSTEKPDVVEGFGGSLNSTQKEADETTTAFVNRVKALVEAGQKDKKP